MARPASITVTSNQRKLEALRLLQKQIHLENHWWTFPTQDPIQGFLGTGPIFIVGDQPSTDAWLKGHPHRDLFYSTLQAVGLENAHLTDVYKKRGLSGQLENGLPTDFAAHLTLLREEISILKPTKIVALGGLAQRLLSTHLSEWAPYIPRVWHFSFVARESLKDDYAAHIRKRIYGKP